MKKAGILLLAVMILGGCTKTKKMSLPVFISVPSDQEAWSGAAYGVACDSSDNVYVVGWGYNYPQDLGGVSPAFWGVRKFDSSGTETRVNWSDTVVTALPHGWNRAYAVTADGSGNVYVAGTIFESDSNVDWYIMKFNSDGVADTVDWNKRFGDAGWNEAFGLAIDSSGDIYAAGYGTNLAGGATGEDWWFKKFDGTTGDEITTGWDKKIDSGGALFDYVQSIAIGESDDIYAICIDGDTNNLMLKKYSSAGVEETANWNKTLAIQYDTANSVNSNGQRIAFDSTGDVYFVGSGKDVAGPSTGNDWIIKKFNSGTGVEDMTWNKAIDGGGNAEAFAVAVDSDDNVYVVGYGVNLYSATSGRDWWIKKFDSNGAEINSGWNKIIHGGHPNDNALETAYGVAIDSYDNVYIVGTVSPSVNVNIWRIMKYDSDGTEQFRK